MYLTYYNGKEKKTYVIDLERNLIKYTLINKITFYYKSENEMLNYCTNNFGTESFHQRISSLQPLFFYFDLDFIYFK